MNTTEHDERVLDKAAFDNYIDREQMNGSNWASLMRAAALIAHNGLNDTKNTFNWALFSDGERDYFHRVLNYIDYLLRDRATRKDSLGTPFIPTPEQLSLYDTPENHYIVRTFASYCYEKNDMLPLLRFAVMVFYWGPDRFVSVRMNVRHNKKNNADPKFTFSLASGICATLHNYMSKL